MTSTTRAGILKRILLTFWPAWISIVVVMNGLDALRAAGMLPAHWKVASGNYKAIVDVTRIYGVPHWVDMLMFLGVIGWELLAAALLWRALRAYHRHHRDRWRRIYEGFAVLLSLFLTFVLTDEVFHDFQIESDHRGISLLLLGTLLVLTLLPERSEA